jgi:hypothetical protein
MGRVSNCKLLLSSRIHQPLNHGITATQALAVDRVLQEGEVNLELSGPRQRRRGGAAAEGERYGAVQLAAWLRYDSPPKQAGRL